MTYDFHSAKTPLPVYWFVDRMSCDCQIRPKTALLYILPKDYVSFDGGPDTFTRRALPLETCLSALPVTWRRPKDQSATHDSSFDIFTCHFSVSQVYYSACIVEKDIYEHVFVFRYNYSAISS